MKKIIKIFVLIFLFQNQITHGQTEIAYKDVTHFDHSYKKLADLYSDYSVVELDLKSIPQLARKKESFVLRTKTKKWVIKLEKNNLFGSVNFVNPQISTYKGVVVGSKNSAVRLTLKDNYISGFIRDEKSTYYIEPLSLHDLHNDKNKYVVYDSKNTSSKLMEGAIDIPFELPNTSNPLHTLTARKGATRVQNSYYLKMAIEADEEYYNIHGENSSIDIISIINMSEEVYNRTFDLNIIITYLNVYKSNDPFDIPTVQNQTFYDAFDVRNDFINHWETKNQHIKRDIAALFTGRNMTFSGVAGGIGVTCKTPSKSYFVCKKTIDSKGDTVTQEKLIAASVLFSHELGHCLSGIHPNSQGCDRTTRQGSIMCGDTQFKSTTPYFSQDNISRMSNFLQTYGTCLTNDLQPEQDYPILWTAKANVTESEENKLTSTTNSNWTAGASSLNIIPANEDGWIETTAGSLTSGTMFGLSYQDTDARWNTIDFNFYLTEYGGGSIRIYNRSTLKKQIQKFSPNDLVRVERIGSTINYKLNNDVIYSQSCDPTKELIADISLYKKGHFLNNSYCSHPPKHLIQWISKTNVTESEKNKLSSTTNNNWTAGAASINIIPANEDGWIETTTGALRQGAMFGLSYRNTDAKWNTIDFNFYISEYISGNSMGQIRIYNRSKRINGDFPSYNPGDKVRLERVGNMIHYKLNDEIFLSQTCDPTKSMIADISLYRKDHHINNSYSSHPAILNPSPKSIDAVQKDLDPITLYPNPTQGQFTIGLGTVPETDTNVQVYNINGVLVYEKLFEKITEPKLQINLEPQLKGLYIIQLTSNTKVTTHKILKL